jgi:hypothetical protein
VRQPSRAWCESTVLWASCKGPETAGLFGESCLSFSEEQLVTEGSRVDQVGEELSKLAVARIVMC